MLFTGAGELEGVRYVDPTKDGDKNQHYLIEIGIENVERPQELLHWDKTQDRSLRELCEAPLNEILQAVVYGFRRILRRRGCWTV